MFIAYQEEDKFVYIPVSSIVKIEDATDDKDLCIYLKDCPVFFKDYRTKEEINELTIAVVPVEQIDFVLTQLHRLGGFTKDEIVRLQEYPNA
jgi:hypothetical protein